jgi:chitodextrinase
MSRFVKTLSTVVVAFAFVGSGAVQSSHAATGGVVAAYGFNEGTGAVLHDLSGNGNNGSIVGADWVKGKYGGGLRFNGSSSWVTVPSSNSLSPTGAVTVEAWIRPQRTGSWRAIAIKEQNSAALSYGLYGSTSTGPAAYAYAGSEENATRTTQLPLYAWSHVSAVYDGTMLSLYVNGSLAARQLAAGNVAETAGALRIGGDAIWGEWFSGTIDELRIYSRALTAPEIQADMSTPVPAIVATGDTSPPSAPTNLAVSGVSPTGSTLSWPASTDNVAVTAYRVYVNGVQAVSVAGLTATVTGLVCGTSYTFGVAAFDAAGNHSATTQTVVSTGSCSPVSDSQPPSVPAAVSAGAVTRSSVALSWSASTDNVGVTGYTVYLNGTTAGSTAATVYTVSGLSCGTSYSFGVDASDAAGNRSGRTLLSVATAACADTSPPTVPAGLSVTSSSVSSVSLAWSASSDNVGVSGYGLYRNGVGAGTSASTTSTLSGLACGTSYTFGVDAFDAAGNRSAVASVSGSTGACPPPPPPGSGSLFVAPSGSDSNPCSQAAPCASFDRAYRVASPGMTVVVAGGTYGGQTINPDPSKASASSNVVFAPAAGAQVTVTGEVKVNGARAITVQDMTVAYWSAQPGSDSLVFQNINSTEFFINQASNVLVKGGDYGPNTNEDAGKIISGTSTPASNITIDGATFHDIASTNLTQFHVECLIIWSADGVTVKNSRFYNCGVFDIFAKLCCGSTVLRNITLVNNWFGATQNGGYFSFDIDGSNQPSLSGIHVRFNSFAQAFNFENFGSIVNSDSVGNVGPRPACVNGLSFAYDIWLSGTCTSTDKAAASGYVNGASNAAQDYHLTPGAAAINAVPLSVSGGCPATDIDGQARPMGSACDAGADEAG